MKQKICAMVLMVIMLFMVLIPVSANIPATDGIQVLSATNESITIWGSLPDAGSVNTRAFRLAQPGRVQIVFRHDTVSTSTASRRVTLYNSDGAVVVSAAPRINTRSTTLSHRFLPAGEYTVVVRFGNTGAWESSLSEIYRVDVNFVANTGQFEITPNNTSTNATPIRQGRAITGRLLNANDRGYFRLTLSRPGAVSLNFAHAHPQQNSETNRGWNVQLLCNRFGAHIDQNVLQTSRNTNIPRVFLSAGTYYVRVSSWGVLQSTADFTITANFTENTGQFKIAPNQTRADATPIRIGQSVIGRLSQNPNVRDNNGVDFYRFTLTEMSEIQLDFRHEMRNGTDARGWNLEIFRRNRPDIVQSTRVLSSQQRTTSEPLTLSRGNYYVRVSRYGARLGNEYTLTVNFVERSYVLGHVTGGSSITIADALQILRFLVGLNSYIEEGNDAWNAARITGHDQPVIADALAILRYLVDLPSNLD